MKNLIVVLLMFPMVVMGQDAPFECDNNYGECGTPEMSGGGNQGEEVPYSLLTQI